MHDISTPSSGVVIKCWGGGGNTLNKKKVEFHPVKRTIVENMPRRIPETPQTKSADKMNKDSM